MKKRLTAYLLALLMLGTSVPAAFATDGPETQPEDNGGGVGAADISTLYDEAASDGITFLSIDDIPANEEVIVAEVVEEDEHMGVHQNAAPPVMSPEREGRVRTLSEQEAEGTQIQNVKTTTNFVSYGAQLGKVVLRTSDGKNVYIGAAMKKLYNNFRSDVCKGTSSAVFKGDSKAIDALGVTYSLKGVDKKYYANICKEMGWLVYLCVDYDTPQMFYSNGWCYMGWGINGSTVRTELTPAYNAGFGTLAQRRTIQNQLNAKVDQIVKGAAKYPRAYDKLKYFHNWLCRNNVYNHKAANTSGYSQDVSGAPWSAAGALLSSSTKLQSPVCEGYARAFELLCHRVGITATVATGDVHMWSNLRYDHKWTGVDVTWDDGSSSAANDFNYEYFLVPCNGTYGHRLNDEYLAPYIAYPVLSKVSSWKELPFYDDMTWQKKGVQYVYQKGYMNGLTCVNFGVNRSITRAEVAVILYNIAGRPKVSYDNRFQDVPKDQWYTSAVLWAAKKGIVSGYKGKYMPNANITREQMAVILYNRAKRPVGTGDLYRFDDFDQIDSWAWDALEWATGRGILNGKSGGGQLRLDPLAGLTRGEAATILMNMKA
ncbi:MAG TPA: hypothetical protein DDX51_05850 [Clostridiales bacterium]|nr:hypothetical protein [Clostridiales bacterium]